MAVGASFKRGSGVITARTAGSGVGTAVKYSGTVAWLLGGEGNYSFVDKLPTRDFPDDTFIEAAAGIGWPCEITVAPDGTVQLFVSETYGILDC